jgi:hypothetical protein
MQVKWLQQQQLTALWLSWTARNAQMRSSTAVAQVAQQLPAAATAVVLQQQQRHQVAAFTCWQTAGQTLL